MNKNRLIPFRMLPASWGLAGQAFDEAEAYYMFDGEELQRRLAEIRHRDDPKQLARKRAQIDRDHGVMDEYDYRKKVLEIDGKTGDRREQLALDLEFGKIDNYQHDRERATLDYTEADLDLALAEIDLAYEKITQREYDKTVATSKQEPWVGIINDGYDQKLGINGVYFEFDWNSYWVEYLRLNGYQGTSEEEIVKRWFQDVCRATALEDDPQESADIVPFSGRMVNQ